MIKIKIGLLNKKRGNFKLQEKFAGTDNVVDETHKEVAHHKQALIDTGYEVCTINWGDSFIKNLMDNKVDLVFNVSSMAEAAILEELEIPFVGSDTAAIAIATDKSLAKKIWKSEGLQTSPFFVAKSVEDCSVFKDNPSFDYPLFIKPVAGRGSAGIDDNSVIKNYEQLVKGVEERLNTIKTNGFKENKLANLHQVIVDFEDAKVVINPKQIRINLFDVISENVEDSDMKCLSRAIEYAEIIKKLGIETEGVMIEKGHWARIESSLSDFLYNKVDNRYFLELKDGSKFWIDHSDGKQEDETRDM